MSTASRPLVSIVTPVYNEERHLTECIESVLAQTYSHWDYTIVDNCSTDATADIARRYARQDRRIRVHSNQEFETAYGNCNVAVTLISPAAKYCKVVLGDDRIFPECLERMVAVAEEHPSVGVVGAYALEGQRVALTGLPSDTTVVPGRVACRRHLLDREYVFGTQNSVLYRADLVRGQRPLYDESDMAGDTKACFALLQSSDFGFVHQVLTFTRVRPGSLNQSALAMQTSWAALLRLLIAYGPACLTQEELDAKLERHLTDYYKFLGKSLLARQGEKFWAYHQGQFGLAGVEYRRVRVIGGLLSALGELLLNPRHSFSLLRRKTSLAES